MTKQQINIQQTKEDGTLDTPKYSIRRVGTPKRVGKEIVFKGYLPRKAMYSWGVLLSWILQVPKSETMHFLSRLDELWVKNGVTFLVLYTKECFRIVQMYVAGTIVVASEGIPIALTRGLPRIIPGPLRIRLRSRDKLAIRLVLSIFQIYRVLKTPGRLKTETITGPFSGLATTLPLYEISAAVRSLVGSNYVLDPFQKALELRRSVSSGPNSPIALYGYFRDLIAWSKEPKLLNKLKQFILLHKGGLEFWEGILGDLELTLTWPEWGPKLVFAGVTGEGKAVYEEVEPFRNVRLGSLSIKEEAAGKVRVFAITDLITQSVMKPLHDSIFDLLKRIPMDGTFNQTKPLDLLREKFAQGIIPGFWSFDLSAATDRLPIDLQSDVLFIMTRNKEFSGLWRDILVDRDWIFDGTKIYPGGVFRYAVGQPMGALSSWGMLALTHHLIVHIAALRVGVKSFTDYALLGDDIVIGHEGVANSYHTLMVEVLGVEINLSKSLVSKDTFEFAKRLVTLEGEVSPVGPKALLLCLKSSNGIPSVLLDVKNKGFCLDESLISRMFSKVPYYIRKAQVSELQWLVKGPFGFVPTVDGLTSGYRNVSALTTVRIASLLDSIDHVKHLCLTDEWGRALKNSINSWSEFKAITHIEFFSEKGVDIQLTWFWKQVDQMYRRDILELVANKPIRRFVFGDGPLIMFDYGRKGYGLEVINYIQTKLFPPNVKPFEIVDPFQEEKVRFPLVAPVKGKNFFRLVRAHERYKDLERNS